MLTPIQNYYRILQIDPAAEQEVIEGAYRRLAGKYHPDKNSSPDATRRMQEINEAYEVLHDPFKRAAYNRKLQTWSERRRAGKEEQVREAGSAHRAEYQSSEQATVRCPVCNSSEVRKVNVVYSTGIASRNPAQVRLSERLAPPILENKVPNRRFDIWLLLILLLVSSYLVVPCIWIIFQPTGDLAFLLEICSSVGIVLAIPVIAVYLFAHFKSVSRVQQAARIQRKSSTTRAEQERAMDRWRELYYCVWDDGVFDPNEKVLILTDQMLDYLYRREKT